MAADPARAKAIFLEAVGKHPPEHWDAYLSAAGATIAGGLGTATIVDD